MAKKIKVAGYSKKTSYEGNIEYRNFSPDLVGVQLASHGGTPLFTMGNFAITTNLDPKINKNYATGKFSDFVTLDNLKLTVAESEVLLKNNTNTVLNLDQTKLKNYALFGSMTEYIRIQLEDIITNWPASLYASPLVSVNGADYFGNTYEDYSYNSLINESTFKVNVTYLVNQYQINFLTNGTIIDTFNATNDLRNMTVNYGSYAISYNNTEYNVLAFTGSTYDFNDYIYFRVEGNPFTGGTTFSNIYYHIKPKKIVENTYFNSITGLQEYLLSRDTLPLYTSNFEYPVRTDDGIIMYTSKSLTWPVTDGYNIDFDTTQYTDYATQLLDIATNYDLNETNLMTRFLVSESISAFDTTPVHLDELHQDTTTGQKVNKTLNIYGVAFDELNQFVQGISFAHVVTYDRKDNVPDKYLKDLARVFGWELVSTLISDDLINNYVTNAESQYSGQSVGMTPVETDNELWRRIILNSPWIWKSKGARKSIEFLINFMGIPKGLMSFNEYIYRADAPLDIEIFKKILEENELSTDLTLYPIDDNGYPNMLPDTDDMYFQNNGLWYRETGGSGSTVDILTGNNPHVGRYDGGYKYINQFRTLIPNFSAVTINTGIELTTTENIFSNYAQGVITDYTGPTYVDIVADDNSSLGECVVYKAEVIKDPMPEPILTPCGCPCEGEDEMLSVCVEKGKPKPQPCKNVYNNYIEQSTGFIIASLNVYNPQNQYIGLKNTIFLDKECCKALGGKSAYMDSDYDGGYEGNRDTATSGYVCCTTNKCGCNIACKWALGEYTVNPDGRVYMKPLEPIQIPENSGNYFLQFKMFYGTGGGAVVTPDGSNCISRYTIPVNGIKDPFTGEIGFGCKLTDLGMRDMAYGEDSTLRNIYFERLGRGAPCCEQPTDYWYNRS
jgi:hypothetical protein